MDANSEVDATGLSAEDLELLAYLLKEEGIDVAPQQVIFPREQQADLPLSFAQERMWFVDQWEPGNPAYNLPLTVRLTGRLDIEALERSLNAIMLRHEALRTS